MTASPLDPERAKAHVERFYEDHAIPALVDYIRIPNKSQAFDKDWAANGHMDKAVALVEAFCKEHGPAGLSVEVVRLPGRTPLIFMELAGTAPGDDTVMIYGHLDKQPEMVGWSEGLGPWTPVRRGDELYGRGGADDGYAAFAAIGALRVLTEQKVPHRRVVVLIEAGEESGSPDLAAYVEHLSDRIGAATLVVCLDSGCGNYDQMWCTTSLRGLVHCELEVETLREGVHSGDASGVVPSTFRVLRQLLSRVEDEVTGEIKLAELHAPIPAERLDQARKAAETLGDAVFDKFPFHGATRPVASDRTELVLNRTWRPTLSITGAEGLPRIADAGNVLRPRTALKLSVRLPPSADAATAKAALVQAITADPPYGATITVTHAEGAGGWNAPPTAPWLERSLASASQTYFGQPVMGMGEGGSIPFIGMLGRRYPAAQFVITGVLGPKSNAHGPNEFLHLPTAKKLTCCVAEVLRDHAARG
jgi:acetylornithine deacetylase/succinyl-diaminopimelate desuccinylase-like protein